MRPDARRIRARRETGLLILVCAALILGSFWLVGSRVAAMEARLQAEFRETLGQAVGQVQEENSVAVRAIEDRIGDLGREMAAMAEILAEADRALDISAGTSRELSGRIEALDRQLAELEKSLEILSQRP